MEGFGKMSEAQAVMLDMNSIYWLVGLFVFTQLGVIVTLLTIGAKAMWFFSKLDSRVDDAKGTAVRAHRRIDKIEGHVGC